MIRSSTPTSRGGAILAALALVLLPACSFSAFSGAASSQEVTVKQSGAPSAVTLHKGQSLALQLAGNPSTGYSWEAVGLNTALLQPSGEPDFTPESQLVGAPGTVILRYKALGTGSTVLQLVYHRTWEKDRPPLQTFNLTVNIVD